MPSRARKKGAPGVSNPGFSRPLRKIEGRFGTPCLPSGVSSVRADFSSLGEADLPDSPRMESGRESACRVERFVSPPADGESSVKSVWGTRTRLAASPSHDKILCRCITNGGDGGTAGNALARGYAPTWSVGLFLFRLGRPPTGCSTMGALERRCFIIGEWGPSVLSDCWQIRPRLTASVTAVTSIPSIVSRHTRENESSIFAQAWSICAVSQPR